MMAKRSEKTSANGTRVTSGVKPTISQRSWLKRGMEQAGGKLPLFDSAGQKVSERTVRSCISKGWAKPWFANPLKPDWMVCKLTQAGRALFVGNHG